MKLYYAPNTCTIGIHLLLEEIGQPFEIQKVDLGAQEQYGPAYTAVSPKSKVPALVRDDGSVLTEFPAIAFWLARTFPEAKLLPDDAESGARALEIVDYVVATVHMQGFTRIFRPGRFAPSEADHPAVQARGREITDAGLALLDKAIAGKDYALGPFSIADGALFYAEYWATERVKQPLPEHLAAHFARMKARPAVQRALAAQGTPLPS